MTINKFEIEGVIEMTPRVFEDDRGYFFESFNRKQFNEIVGQDILFVQDNQSFSTKHVLRGMHFQKPPFAQGKLVRVTAGKVLDVAVDLRKKSATYGQHVKCILSAEKNNQLWIPEGFAHGFLALSENATFAYKCTNYYNAESEGSLNWNDEDFAIDWGINEAPILSSKDLGNESFINFKSPF
ncbi:dTDP-4-dehydrorhamnose 3,5-epimerase [Crocinitomix catalasitica]|uniref:dTDP-4-dehydrorhamnose 3,5-epimerase n=1 Tax=Crocinitomix catalasitica TaxID=184607 RepID=UPI000481F03B|nr:dTDP-4-dehydrorhamnose 3,5-epimerase [Crocinitomix catalasitica]